ncbi:MAG TPA: XrtA system polysaccharide chain length determinant [Steroidobacteraceae bacterium]|nr:XrtA system polysaccharide chain length determinant [Steroidobacteraceae bacterium]
MRELIAQLIAHMRGAWRYRWYAVAVAWALAVVGWGAITALPPVYEARARVYVDTESVLKPLLNGLAVNPDTENRVNMMARMIMGRTNLERVARETDLSLRAHTPEQFEELVNSLGRHVTLESGGSAGASNVLGLNASNVYSLRFTDGDPAMAQRVVQHLLDAFVEDTLGIKRADTDRAQQFLQTQIREYETRLRAAEDRLAEFKQKNVGLIPGQTGDYYTRLQGEQNKLEDLRARYRLAEQAHSEIAKQLQGEEPTFGLFNGGGSGEEAAAAADPQIADLQHQLDQLLLIYTDKHPKVIAIKATIAQLQARKAASRPQSKDGMPVPANRTQAAAMALDINPVYQNLRLEQSRTEVAMAELRQQAAEEERVVADLKGRVNTIPQIEAQLTQLTRDYEVTKSEHTALVQRLESARLSDQADSSNNPVKFRIIEPPTRPLRPVGPNRILLMTGALLAAVGAGLGVALLLNQMKPVFVSRSLLAAVTGLPVLGSISFVQQRPDRREPLLLGLACGALLLAYVLGLLVADSVSSVIHALTG